MTYMRDMHLDAGSMHGAPYEAKLLLLCAMYHRERSRDTAHGAVRLPDARGSVEQVQAAPEATRAQKDLALQMRPRR